MRPIPLQRHSKGFTSFEILIVLAVIGVVTIAVAPMLSQKESYVKQTAKEVSSILEAAEVYYWRVGSFPVGVNDLTSELNIGGVNNPWGNPYLLSSTGKVVRVSTAVPSGANPCLYLTQCVLSGGTLMAARTVGGDCAVNAVYQKTNIFKQ